MNRFTRKARSKGIPSMNATAMQLADMIMDRNALLEEDLLHPLVRHKNAEIRRLMKVAVQAWGSEVKREINRIINARMLLMLHP